MRNLSIVGHVLLTLSVYPLYLMGVELLLGQSAYERYEVSQFTGENYDYRSADFHDHRVSLLDDLEVDSTRLPKDENVYFKCPVKIIVDSRDYSLPDPVDVRVFNGSKSISNSVALLNLKDRRNGDERLAVIQRVGGEHYLDDLRYRVLFVQPDGSVTEEWFTYAERDNPLYRTMLARYVHPEPLGFRSQVLSYWPSIFYPLLYPWITGIVGIVLTIIGAAVLLKGRSNVAMPSP